MSGQIDYRTDDGDEGTDVEQIVCLYYDPSSGLDSSVETDNDSYATWQDTNSLWIYGVGSEAQLLDGSGYITVADSGMQLDSPNDYGGGNVTATLGPMTPTYSSYILVGYFDECEQQPLDFDDYGCYWEPPYAVLGVSLNLPLPSPASIDLSSSSMPSTFTQPVTFTAAVSSGATGDVTFLDRGTSMGTAPITPVSVTNLMPHSNDFNSWNNKTTLVTPNATGAPDATTSASLIAVNPSGAYYDGESGFACSAGPVTHSVWLKKNASASPTAVWLSVRFFNSAGAEFILTGQVFTPTSSWQRFSETFTAPSGTASCWIGLELINASTGGAGIAGDSVYAWGAQVENASSARQYVSTTTGPQSWSGGIATFTTSALTGGVHLIDATWPGDANYSAATSNSISQDVGAWQSVIGLTTSNPSIANGACVTFAASVSPVIASSVSFYDGTRMIGSGTTNTTSTTNLFPQSVDMSNSAWFSQNETVTAGVGPAPDNSNTATQFVSWNNDPATGQVVTTGNISGRTFTASIWVKAFGNTAQEQGIIWLFDSDWSQIIGCSVTLSTGWNRVSCTKSFGAGRSATGLYVRFDLPDSAPVAGDMAWAWGPQLEEASSPGPYIATTTSAQTQTAGTALLTTNALTGGHHTVTAYVSGNLSYSGGVSNAVAEYVTPLTPSVAVNCSPSTVSFGVTPPTCTATVSNPSATGTVSFTNNGNAWSTATIQNGSASLVGVTYLQAGTYTVNASYSGDDGDVGSSASTTYTVQGSGQNVGVVYSYTVPAGGYDTNGNVLSYSDNVVGGWTFGYDQLNRLTSGTSSWATGGYTNFSWAYDAFGNRLGQWATGPNNASMQQVSTYNGQNQMTNAGDVYDGAGDVQYDGKNLYLYDAEGRICAVNFDGYMTGYQYDAAGNRIAKGTITGWSCDITTNGLQQTAGYVVDAGGQQLTETDGSGNWLHTNIWAGGKQIGTYDAQGLHFYLDDPLGTRRAQVSADGTKESTYQSFPFGDGYLAQPYTSADDPTENHFTGKERDTESGNDYMFARYYNSATGRFLSPDWDAKSSDPVPYAKLDNPQSLNLYGYVLNNPLGKADPDGHDPWQWALPGGGVLAGAEAGAAGGLPGGPVAWAVGAAIGATAVLLHEIPLPKGPATDGFGAEGCMACAAASTTKGDKPSTLAPGPFAGDGIPARGPDRNFTPDERDATNKPGVCHTCGTTDPGTKSGNFIPDHQPPNALNPTGGAQRLYPHCIGCSRTQGGEVNAAKPKPAPAPKPKPQDQEQQ